LLDRVDQTACLCLHHHRVLSVRIDQLLLAALEDEIDALESDDEGAWFAAAKDRADGAEDAAIDHVFDLLGRGLRSRVGKAPDSLLLDVEGLRVHQLDDLVDQADVDAALDLLGVACRHIGDRPADLLPDGFLGVIEELREGLQHVAVDGLLRVLVASRENVAERAQRGNCDDHVAVAQQLAQTRHHVALQEDENAVVAALIRNVGERPADVVQDFRVVSLRKDARKSRDGTANLLKLRARLALAEVGERPDRVAHKSGVHRGLVDQVADPRHDVLVEEGLAEAGVVARDISQAPDGLLFDLNVRV